MPTRKSHQQLEQPHAVRPDRFARVPWAAVIVFILVSCGLAWLVILPLWLTQPGTPAFAVLAGILPALMMFSPLIATCVVMFAMRVPATDRMRLLGMWPLRPAKRTVWFIVGGLIIPIVLVVVSLGISVLFGWTTLDLTNFSGFQTMLESPLDEASLMPVVLAQLALIPIAALFNAIPAFGEEIGWRGWLLPALRPLGIWPALLLNGLIWGLWHTPIILLGQNFNSPNVWGVLLMVLGCIAWGTLFGWTRLRTGSVWPAVIGHGALNASAGLVLLVSSADVPLNMALVNPLGVSGWIVLAIVITVLILTGQFKKEPQLS